LAILLQQFFSLQQSPFRKKKKNPSAISLQQFPFSQKTPHQKALLLSVSLLNPIVNKEVEQQFSGRGMALNKRNLCSCF
jgi:hypothetical protein